MNSPLHHDRQRFRENRLLLGCMALSLGVHLLLLVPSGNEKHPEHWERLEISLGRASIARQEPPGPRQVVELPPIPPPGQAEDIAPLPPAWRKSLPGRLPEISPVPPPSSRAEAVDAAEYILHTIPPPPLAPTRLPLVRGTLSEGAFQAYLAAVKEKIEESKTYPPLSRRENEEGRTSIRFRIDGEGMLQAAEVIVSSGHPRLDEAAREAVLRAAPFPPPPWPGDSPGSITVTIVFSLSP